MNRGQLQRAVFIGFVAGAFVAGWVAAAIWL